MFQVSALNRCNIKRQELSAGSPHPRITFALTSGLQSCAGKTEKISQSTCVSGRRAMVRALLERERASGEREREAAPWKASKAGNQRSQNSYPRFKQRQSLARLRGRHAKSRVDQRFCVSRTRRSRGKHVWFSSSQSLFGAVSHRTLPRKKRIGNQKAMPRKHIVVCVWFSSLPLQQLQPLSTLPNILFISPLSPGRASTKSSLSTMCVASKRDRVQVGLDTFCKYPLNFEFLPH